MWIRKKSSVLPSLFPKILPNTLPPFLPCHCDPPEAGLLHQGPCSFALPGFPPPSWFSTLTVLPRFPAHLLIPTGGSVIVEGALLPMTGAPGQPRVTPTILPRPASPLSHPHVALTTSSSSHHAPSPDHRSPFAPLTSPHPHPHLLKWE